MHLAHLVYSIWQHSHSNIHETYAYTHTLVCHVYPAPNCHHLAFSIPSCVRAPYFILPTVCCEPYQTVCCKSYYAVLERQTPHREQYLRIEIQSVKACAKITLNPFSKVTERRQNYSSSRRGRARGVAPTTTFPCAHFHPSCIWNSVSLGRHTISVSLITCSKPDSNE